MTVVFAHLLGIGGADEYGGDVLGANVRGELDGAALQGVGRDALREEEGTGENVRTRAMRSWKKYISLFRTEAERQGVDEGRDHALGTHAHKNRTWLGRTPSRFPGCMARPAGFWVRRGAWVRGFGPGKESIEKVGEALLWTEANERRSPRASEMFEFGSGARGSLTTSEKLP